MKYVTIPACILDAEDLTGDEKILLAVIHNLQQKKDQCCWATNGYLAEATRKTQKSVESSLYRLFRSGWVQRINPDGEHRKLRAVISDAADARGEQHRLNKGTQSEGGGGTQSEGDPPQSEYALYKDRKEIGNTSKKEIESQALEIYKAYPRKVGKPKALLEIKKALKTISFEALLSLTKQYASARCNADAMYTPHPSTWFHQQRYNDDPNTWNPESQPKAPPVRIGGNF